MADKEATVFVIDVGKSMGTKHNGRDESDLDWSLRYIWDKITSTVRVPRRKRLNVANSDNRSLLVARQPSWE